MTTVICDGFYMLADKRISSVHHVGLFKDDPFPVVTDNCCKIIMPESSYFDGVPVRAIGLAGDSRTIELLVSCIQPEQDFDQATRTVELSIKYNRMSVSALLMLADRRVVHYQPRNTRGTLTKMPYATYKPGEMVGIGSGAHYAELVRRNLKTRVHIQDFFLFLVHQDSGSSETHDAYSIAQNILVTSIPVTQEGVKQAVHRVQEKLDFFNRSFQPRNKLR